MFEYSPPDDIPEKAIKYLEDVLGSLSKVELKIDLDDKTLTETSKIV